MKYTLRSLFFFLLIINFTSFAAEERKDEEDHSETERIAQNLRLLGGRSILDNDVSRMRPYLMPSASIGLHDVAFRTPLMPTNGLTALLFMLFPYPNHFGPNTTDSEAWSKLPDTQIEALATLCETLKSAAIRDCATVGGCAPYLFSVKAEDALSKFLLNGGMKWSQSDRTLWDSIDDDTLNRFVGWYTMRSIAKRIAQDIASFGTEQEIEKIKKEHPEGVYGWVCNNWFPGVRDWVGLDSQTLETLGGTEDLVRAHFGQYVFQYNRSQPSMTKSAFDQRLKVLLMKQFTMTLSEAVVDDAFTTDKFLSPSDLLKLYRSKRTGAVISEELPEEEKLKKEDIDSDSQVFFSASLPQRVAFLKAFLGVFDPIPMGSVRLESVTFSDCVEIGLLNMILAALYQEKGDHLSWPVDILPHNLRKYLTEKSGIHDHRATESHNAWGALVADLPGVNYIKRTSDGKGCEIRPGVISSLNVLSYFFGLDPLERTRDQRAIEERLSVIEKQFQGYNSTLTLSLDDDSLNWNHVAEDYVGNIVLGRGDRFSGKLALTTGHGEFSWTQKADPTIEKLIEGATTEKELLMTVSVVNNEDIFKKYWTKFSSFSVPPAEWDSHIFQMDLRAQNMQAAVFGVTYAQPEWENFSLSIASRGQGAFSDDLLKHMGFLQGTGPSPSPIFLRKLLEIAPELLGKIWDGTKQVSLLNYYIHNHKEMLSPKALSHIEYFNSPTMVGWGEGEFKEYIPQMTNLSGLSTYSMDSHFLTTILTLLQENRRLIKLQNYSGPINSEILPYFNQMVGLEFADLDFGNPPVFTEDQIITLMNTYFSRPAGDSEDERTLSCAIPFDSETIDRIGGSVSLNGGILRIRQSIPPYQTKEFEASGI